MPTMSMDQTRSFKHTLGFVLKTHNPGNQARSEGKRLPGDRGDERLPSTKDEPSWWKLESLNEEPGWTYTCVPKRSRIVAEEVTPQRRGVQGDRQGLPSTHQCSSTVTKDV